jgi:hypothetical protein
VCRYGRLSRHPFYPPHGLNSGVLPLNLTRIRLFDLSPDNSDPRVPKERRRIRAALKAHRSNPSANPEPSAAQRYRLDPYPLHALFSDLNKQYEDQIVWGDQDLLNIFLQKYPHLLKLIECPWYCLALCCGMRWCFALAKLWVGWSEMCHSFATHSNTLQI